MEMTEADVHLPTIYQENGISSKDSAALGAFSKDFSYIWVDMTTQPSPTYRSTHAQTYPQHQPLVHKPKKKSVFNKAKGLAQDDSGNHYRGWLLSHICPCSKPRLVPQYHSSCKKETATSRGPYAKKVLGL